MVSEARGKRPAVASADAEGDGKRQKHAAVEEEDDDDDEAASDGHDGSSRSHCAMILMLRQLERSSGTVLTTELHVIDMAGATGNTEAWIYGLDADLDEITVTGGFDEVPGTITTHELADGQTIQKVSYEGTDAILDLYFADGGNVDSTFLDDKIKFES